MKRLLHYLVAPGMAILVAFSVNSVPPAYADRISNERLEKQKRYLEMRERERAEKKQQQQREQHNKQVRQRNCKVAKSRMNKYKTARALYEYDKNGKKVYLSKSKRRQAEKQAAADVKKWCR